MVATDFFSVSECKGQKTIDGEQVPLVLTPSRDGKVEALKANREWVEAKVVSNSGALLRGFDVRDAVEFNSIVEALGWPDIRNVGPAPRTHVHGRVWTTNESPLEEFIYYHHEMAWYVNFISSRPGTSMKFLIRITTIELINFHSSSDQGVPGTVILFCEVPSRPNGQTPFALLQMAL
jgi:hypothetical protein